MYGNCLCLRCGKSIFSEHWGVNLKIYGAKTIALRAYYYLKSRNINVDAFLVSNRFENPLTLYGKNVLRIEDEKDQYDYVVVAVSCGTLEIVKNLKNYNIKKLIVIHPCMYDEFPSVILISNESRISEKSLLNQEIQIVTDETSVITIEDGVVVKENVIIMATDHSSVYIGENVVLGKNTFVTANNCSRIEIGADITIQKKNYFKSENSSCIEVGRQTSVNPECMFSSMNHSLLKIDEENSIETCSMITVNKQGTIKIGIKSTFGRNLNIGCEQTVVDIGADNQFSFDVKIFVGAHTILDQISGEEITGYKSVRTGNHVWIGMGATLLPGCEIGNGSIAGAASVVNTAIPENCTCAGNTAKVIRQNIEWER